MTFASLGSGNLSINREMTSWGRELVNWATQNIKRLVKLDDGFRSVPRVLEQRIHDLQKRLLRWLRSNADSEMGLAAKAKAVLKDRELNEVLHEIRRDVESIKPVGGGPVTPGLQLLMSNIRAPELLNAPENSHAGEVIVISDHYLGRMANGSVALSLSA